ncbi:MAG: type II toxin-antitoxin system HicA family toxin [Coriobacteriales bacterium]|nr:type II toxin-antitoxin system HicA family toxin [Coriobacteriales bacterium]
MPQKTRDTMSRLEREGWKGKHGKGDHWNYKKDGVANIITIDVGEKEVDKNIYRRIARIAGWE